MLDVLVLNASYEVLNITRWQRAITLVFSGKAEVLEESNKLVHSALLEMKLPSVIRMTYYIKKPHVHVPFSRSNIFLRDGYVCQYCGIKANSYDLTLDHIVPKSLGGESCWENVVTACQKCNSHKGDRPLECVELKLIRKPKMPQFYPSLFIHFRAEWEKYVLFKPNSVKQTQ